MLLHVFWSLICLGHYKWYFCFWSGTLPRIMRAGVNTDTPQTVKVENLWPIIKHSRVVLYFLY